MPNDARRAGHRPHKPSSGSGLRASLSSRNATHVAAPPRALGFAGLGYSIVRTGKPYDNAFIESFMKLLKHEVVSLEGYRTIANLSVALPPYLKHVYNGTRPLSAVGYTPPAEYEQVHRLTRSA